VARYPLISSFEDQVELKRWQVKDAAISLVRDHATHGLNSAKVLLLPGKYPGLISDYFIGEWRGYQTFACDIYLSGNTR